MVKYSPEPADKKKYTAGFDRTYSRFAAVCDRAVKWLPVWRRWISQVIPHIRGPRVLEVSFGTGYLLTRYAGQFSTHGIDYNKALADTAKRNLESSGVSAAILQADVERLPYPAETFDTLVNTMAFSGYPDGGAALLEMRRVLKPGGRLVLVDIAYPNDRNWLGVNLTRIWAGLGDIIRDMQELLQQQEFDFTDDEIGGYGSVHLYVAAKR